MVIIYLVMFLEFHINMSIKPLMFYLGNKSKAAPKIHEDLFCSDGLLTIKCVLR